ncbi:uncharacterized protein [Spinacia oleracea]|uniref:Uncharacterized protein n=1 Tax=Spinacia oleracea TaxID=3562 RepID=A0A9R0K9T0_SPIOL|nr:uncharacterized protein LOC110802642 [Spinacia oleracea]
MADLSKLHPATTVTNIKACIHVVLDYEGSQFNNWATLFKLHCRANLVLEHILPSTASADADATTLSNTDKTASKALWERLDDIVRQWIYDTNSNDLLNTIINQDDTAADTWNRLVQLFQANKSAHALALDVRFTCTKLVDFPNVKAYCTSIKILVDSLANIGHPVSDELMVLRTLRGLTEEFKTFWTTVHHCTPLPTFEKLRSMFDLEEDSHGKELAPQTGSDTALLSHMNVFDNSSSHGQHYVAENSSNNRGKSNSRGKRNNHNRDGGGNRNNHGGHHDSGNRN